MPTHFASVQRNAKNFASVVITLRNKGLFGSHDFWHGVCIKHKASANATRYQKGQNHVLQNQEKPTQDNTPNTQHRTT